MVLLHGVAVCAEKQDGHIFCVRRVYLQGRLVMGRIGNCAGEFQPVAAVPGQGSRQGGDTAGYILGRIHRVAAAS